MVFSEASEGFWQFLEQDISDKQIERVYHCYGEKLDNFDWSNAFSDSIQLKIDHKREDIYVMVGGSMMLLTREDGWRLKSAEYLVVTQWLISKRIGHYYLTLFTQPILVMLPIFGNVSQLRYHNRIG